MDFKNNKWALYSWCKVKPALSPLVIKSSNWKKVSPTLPFNATVKHFPLKFASKSKKPVTPLLKDEVVTFQNW
jgi:hypothetical protein